MLLLVASALVSALFVTLFAALVFSADDLGVLFVTSHGASK